VLKARTSDIASSSGACVVRPFNVVGKNQPITTPVGEWLSFVKSAPLEGATLTLLNGGLIRDFVSLPFVAQVILHLSTSEIQTDSVNVCTGNGISFLEMAQHLISVSGKSIAIHDAGVGQISKVIGNPMKVGRFGFQEVSNSQNLAELIYAR
jgi:nucleoside-diphosphate-sugar epimerase